MSDPNLCRVKSPTGKVHYAYLIDKDKGVPIYDPYCNSRAWLGDYWGKRWVPTDEPVTCGNCLSAIGSVDLPPAEKLINLGNEIRQSKIAQHKKFLGFAKECPLRKIEISDMFSGYDEEDEDDEGEYVFSCEHSKCKDSWEWWCHPMNCPHMALVHGLGEISKPDEKEIKDYEDSRRTKKD